MDSSIHKKLYLLLLNAKRMRPIAFDRMRILKIREVQRKKN